MVQRTMRRDDLDVRALHETLLLLKPFDFHKTMLSEADGISMLDVYRPIRGSQRLYLKFKLMAERDRVFVLSFKKDTSR